MRSLLGSLLVFLSVLLGPLSAHAATRVAVTGDVRIQGGLMANQFFTGYNATASKAEDSNVYWQRVRLRTDFIQSSELKFRFGMRMNNTPWGNGTLTVDNPQVSLDINQAYLQFALPGTRSEVTAGLQPLSFPQSRFFTDSVVLGTYAQNTSCAAFMMSGPLLGNRIDYKAGFARFLDSNAGFQPDTVSRADTFDSFLLTLDYYEGTFRASPWAAAGWIGNGTTLPERVRNNLVSGGYFVTGQQYSLPVNFAGWGGLAFEWQATDNWKLFADAIVGSAAPSDKPRLRRQGYFLDAAMEYQGFSLLTPQASVWYGSGENASLSDGSERMPAIRGYWNLNTAPMLFEGNQPMNNESLLTNPLGSWGFGLSLKNIAVVEDLASSLTFAAAFGTNDPAGLRKAVLASGGNGRYLTMGKDLALGESVVSISLDHRYTVTEQLALFAETGWASFQGARSSIWNISRPVTHDVMPCWKAILGMRLFF